MSSLFVRTEIENFLTANIPSETQVILDGEFGQIQDVVREAGVTGQDPWLGIQYVPSEEIPVSITSSNTTGKYREIGVVLLHIVAVARIGAQAGMLTRAEALRSLFRGQRIAGSILIEEVTPPNFGLGATLEFEGGYIGCAVSISYKRDFDL